MNLLFFDSIALFWRKGRDSNPRYVLPHAGFQDRYLQPLGHLSTSKVLYHIYHPTSRARCVIAKI